MHQFPSFTIFLFRDDAASLSLQPHPHLYALHSQGGFPFEASNSHELGFDGNVHGPLKDIAGTHTTR